MPLVTRQATQGNLFSQAIEPPNWLNGDMWVDTDNANVAVNRSGTAQQIAPGTTAAGDILFSNGANTVDNLAIGTALQILQTNAGADAPEWAAAPASVTVSIQNAEISADITTTSTTIVDATGLQITLADRSGGFHYTVANLVHLNSNTGVGNHFRWNDGGTIGNAMREHCDVGANNYIVNITINGALDGGDLQLEWKTDANTATLQGDSANRSDVVVLEVS